MKYIIVKHAGTHWHTHFLTDPKLVEQDISLSVGKTLFGKENTIQEVYLDIDKAKREAARINKIQTLSDFGVCVLKEKK